MFHWMFINAFLVGIFAKDAAWASSMNNSASIDNKRDGDQKVVHGDGVFSISGLFPITEPTLKINPQSGITMATAMRYAFEKLNVSFYGYDISYTIMDVAREKKVREEFLNAFIGQNLVIIGPYSSETSYISNILSSTFMMQAIAYGATYSDFHNEDVSHKYMLRTVHSDVYRVHAVLDIVEHLKWNYVSVVSSFNHNGEREAITFVSKLYSIDACLANQLELPKYSTEEDYFKVVKTLLWDHRVKAIVLFTTKEDSRNFLISLRALNVSDHFFILCVYGCTNYVEVTEEIEETAMGVLSLDIHIPEVKGFKEYFLNQKGSVEQPQYFKDYWEDLFRCYISYHNYTRYFKQCTGNERLTDDHYYPLTPIHAVINAVDAVTRGVKALIERECSVEKTSDSDKCKVKSEDIAKYADTFAILMNNMSASPDGTIFQQSSIVEQDDSLIQYDLHNYIKKNSKYNSLLVGEWSMTISEEEKRSKAVEVMKIRKGAFKLLHGIHLRNGSNASSLDAICSQPCNTGYISVSDNDISKTKCCWTCRMCPANSIVQNNTCNACRDIEKADNSHQLCEALTVRFIDFNNDILPYFFTLASMIGIGLVLFVVAFFIKYNHHRLVRASGRDLCYMILLGIGLTFSCPFLFFAKPTLAICVIREGLPGIAFLICYAPLFLKVYRIFRIFRQATKSIQRPPMVSSRSLLLMSLGIVSVQMLLVAVWFMSNVPQPTLKPARGGEHAISTCMGDTSPVLLFLNLAMSVCFMLACTYLAFKTRHFPKNYNEAKYIGITLYITCVAWSIFLSAYFLIPEKDFLREYLMMSICTIVGYVTIFGLFGHKIKLLTFQDAIKNISSNLPTWYLSHSSGNGIEERMVTDPSANGSSEQTD